MSRTFRYPGLLAFTERQAGLFFGRQQETRELFNLIAVEKSTVLFSASGIGKSSLLFAGVAPLLESAGLVPVALRFGDERVRPETHFFRQFNLAHALFSRTMPGAMAGPATDSTFWEWIKARPFTGAQGQPLTPVLIFDQFEELFTLYPAPEQRQRFIEELAALILEEMPRLLRASLRQRRQAGQIDAAELAELEKPPAVKLVFAIRSDMLHFIDELSAEIPNILRSRYQLFGLSPAQAEMAISRPAALPGPGFASPAFSYTPDALAEILDTLTKNEVVEPFQLQAVCQALEERLVSALAGKPGFVKTMPRSADDLPAISSHFFGGKTGLKRILEDFYQKRISELPEAWQQPAQLLIEEALINENKRRRSMDVQDLLERKGVTQELLDLIEDSRLVRKEPRLDSFYYELSHDALLEPILTFRQERRLQAARQEVSQERRKARVLMVVSAVSLVLLALAVYLKITADKATAEARDQAFNARWMTANFIKGEGQYEAALAGLRDARPFADDPNKKALLDTAAQHWTKAWQFSKAADSLFALGDLSASLEQYRQALNASSDNRLLEKMLAAENQIAVKVKEYLTAADGIAPGTGHPIACAYLQKALKLAPNDPEVQRQLRRRGCPD